jgi:hypothetical protein
MSLNNLKNQSVIYERFTINVKHISLKISTGILNTQNKIMAALTLWDERQNLLKKYHLILQLQWEENYKYFLCFFHFISSSSYNPIRDLGLVYFKPSGWTSWMQDQTIANPLPSYDNKRGRAHLFLERNSNPRSHCSCGPNPWTRQTVWLLKAVKLVSEKKLLKHGKPTDPDILSGLM